ncbi:MAG: cyanophycin synthetase [Candidatus Korarchaeota archaeon]|nr:cyanophycin synthetase [Candidatus Korarchaeota archaeon]NIU82776.1 cyanophycin synthetase [Candidatus Thorarchaeota archaeon]NIW13909.1 cyanophycin synthetase [Candidatus Thorarchaeota archaeon]NIW52026.1 cyanophycin synthetase [Candidatus Korarchaeota archaeon]
MTKLNIPHFRILHRRNIYHPNKRLIKALIHVEDDEPQFTRIPSHLISWLRDHFPELKEHSGHEQNLFKAMEEGFPLYAILPFLAITLQNRVAWQEEVHYAHYRDDGEEGFPLILFEYLNEGVGEEALFMARDIVEEILRGKEPPLEPWMEYLEEVYFDYTYGPSTRAIVNAAKARDIPVTRLEEKINLVQLGYGKPRRLIWAATTDQTSLVGADIAQDKMRTKQILDSIGVPVPRGEVVRSEEGAIRVWERLKSSSVVVKPQKGSKGRGVSTEIKKKDELIKAYHQAKEISSSIVVEEFVEGWDHRILVVDGEVVAVARKLPAHVVGDGERTIRKLIEKENEKPERGKGHELPLTKINVDDTVHKKLEDQNLTLDSVPSEGKRVWLKDTANLSTGGGPEDLTGKTHPEIELMAKRVAKLLGMDICGIDVVAVDVTKPLKQSGLMVLEVNAAPGLRMHAYPQDRAEPVGEAIVSMLFSQNSMPRIPIVGVTGTNGKTTIVRLLAYILRQGGKTVGCTTTEGIYIDSTRILDCDCTGPWSAQAVLRDPSVDIAVFELARGGMCRKGLSFDQMDIGIMSTIAEDHLGQYGIETKEDLAEVKGLVYEAVDPEGYGIVNADDPLIRQQAERIRGAKVMVSMEGKANDFFRSHVRNGAIGVTISGNIVVVYDGKKTLPLVDYTECPLTFEGLADFNVQNILFASAAAYLLDIPPTTIKRALLSFAPRPSMNPGRTNLLRLGKSCYALIDYAHNPQAIQFVGQFINRFAKRKQLKEKVAIFSLPGDRTNASIRNDVKAIAKHFDSFIVKEDAYKRGREPGEMAALIKRYLRELGVDDDQITTILDEGTAVLQGLKCRNPNSISWITCDDVDLVLSIAKKIEAFQI